MHSGGWALPLRQQSCGGMTAQLSHVLRLMAPAFDTFTLFGLIDKP